ncbi:hypothetical protein Mp_2g16730 [Marchantia polymorpha subsp. ruderalis]|uniref:Uncharacterized protein n=1 Tax=Marchantia polymorpha TaxID=3197 RepID=A0A2R6WCJ7_MARPO|nr:hypothetical protein MARPO_0109s0014 [Marchantia polymorpha]BBN02623.1 hypothetical protein Mp_2g16730 [Marchantia polymorpha subsp. ruderalis]|eukprot:PTQ31581.1 hypothetical protein MARPO_0109s0014 [Marchantia polymorpha]
MMMSSGNGLHVLAAECAFPLGLNRCPESQWKQYSVAVPEWLSGMTRNHVGFARAGSNPAGHGTFSSDSQ